jgi:hypothetical protein
VGDRSARSILFSLPLASVAVVCFAIFFVGAPRSWLGARVWGGPTEGVTHLALRLVVLERVSDLETPRSVGAIGVEARLADGRSMVRAATTDEAGMAAVVFEFPGKPISGPVQLVVSRPGRNGVLANGSINLAVGDWLGGLHQHGGWLPGKQTGPLSIRVALGRGACAVPFVDPLIVEVRDATGPVDRATISFEPDGLDMRHLASPLLTGPNGRVTLPVAPKDSVASLRVIATRPDGSRGEWYAMIPVAVGALHADVVGGALSVEAAVPIERAYWALESEREKLAGGIVALAPNARGGATASVSLPALPKAPLWAVVSREPELDSASTVGYPIGAPGADPLTAEPPVARAVPDHLLLDGLVFGERAEAARRREARNLAIGFSALALVLAALLLVRESWRSAARLEQHLRDVGAEAQEVRSITPRTQRFVTLAVALVCVAMGFAVVALVAMYRMS